MKRDDRSLQFAETYARMRGGMPPLLCIAGGHEELLDDSIRLVRNAGIAGVNATLHIAAGMQHVYAIWAGAFPEADAAIALVGDWVRAHTGEFAT